MILRTAPSFVLTVAVGLVVSGIVTLETSRE
jgi:hypothetical protein